MRRALVLMLWLASTGSLSAQHYSAWTRGTLLLPINNNWSTAAEFQYRTQNDPASGNPFQRNLLKSYRHWVYYKLNDNVQFELSPFSYYESYSLMQTVNDRYKAPVKEFRVTAAVNLEHKIVKPLTIISRTGLEYRDFFQNADIVRLRSKLGLRYDVGGWSVNAYNEQLLNISGVSMDHFFDQSRLGLSAAHSLGRNLKVEAGYLHIDRLLKDRTSTIQENNVVLNVTYKLKK